MELRITSFDELDAEAYCDLQKEAFARIFRNNRFSSEFMVPSFFRWKYLNPFGSGRICSISEKGRLIASNAMFPLMFCDEGRLLKGWQYCDVATHPDFRGRGYFQHCIRELQNGLEPGELLVGFPNRDSKKGLLNAGWMEDEVIPLYVKRLLNFGKSGESCRRVHSFENPAADFFDSLRRSGSPHFFKNNAYLNWRYSHHPTNQYSSFTYEEEGKLKGILVLRDLNIRKRRFLVIMELLGNEQSTFRSLLGQAVFEASKLKIPWLAYLGNAFERSWMLRRGFFPVPAWIQPKRQLLMGTVAGMGNQDIFKRAWSVQTGDWDGF